MSSRIEKINGIIYLVAEVDAAQCRTDKMLYAQFAEHFRFPATASNSYGNVFLDYMRDLAWLPQKNFKLIVRNLQKAKKQDARKLADLHDTLQTICEYWQEEKQRANREGENNFVVEFEG